MLFCSGCKHIQLDEPVFMRDVTKCLDYGIEHASKCIDGLGNDVTKTIHLCCGYPQYYVSFVFIPKLNYLLVHKFLLTALLMILTLLCFFSKPRLQL